MCIRDRHFDSLDQVIKGKVPSVDCNDSKGKNYNPAATYDSLEMCIRDSCIDDPREIASVIGERTHSAVVKVIGKKMIFYRHAKKNPKIKLPE